MSAIHALVSQPQYRVPYTAIRWASKPTPDELRMAKLRASVRRSTAHDAAVLANECLHRGFTLAAGYWLQGEWMKDHI